MDNSSRSKDELRVKARPFIELVLGGKISCAEAASQAGMYVWEMYDAVMESLYECDGVEPDDSG